MKRLKILALNWRDPLHPEAGGAELHLDRILTHLAKTHDVVLVTTRYKSAKSYHYHGYEVLALGHPFLFHMTFRLLWMKRFRHYQFDIIIDDISKIGLQTPKYIKNIPIIAIFHHVHGHTLFQLLPYPMALYVFMMERIALKAYTNTPIIVVSESSRRELLDIADFKDITILPNGIDADYLTIRSPQKTPYQLCSIGRLTVAKRVDLSLEVFANIVSHFPQAKFLIMGKGHDEDRLRQLTYTLNIHDSVEFLGFVSEAQKITILRASMALLFTSEKEGWGITAIEASASHTPVFGFRVAGIVDSVKENVNGHLVPFGAVNALSDKILEYFRSTTHEQLRLQGESYCYAKNFDWNRITQEFELILLNMIS